MGRKDPRIDAYIKRAQPFARPILSHLRATVHAACPEVEETLKWSHPSFLYHGMLCGMAAFKEHAAFGFWKGKLIVDANGRDLDDAMGQFGRLASVRDLPARRALVSFVKKAMALNEAGVTVRRVVKPKPRLATPSDLGAALAKNRRALATFKSLSPSARRDYVEWVVEAKRPETRARRIATAVEWMAEGKRRNWKYEAC